MSCRINKLEIQGFRAFGKNGQTLDLPSQLAAVWGPNSQGKTSLAEAVEFLLTGQIVRRALMASSQDEFADALRNAHLPAGTEVFVQAVIVCANGIARTIKRALKNDYGKKQDCETILQINGKAAIEADLAGLGIILSQPPLRAPVLAQHTLGYMFSARPQDRASYFKALLEVTDLEDFRNQVAALENDIVVPADPLVGKLELASTIAEAGKIPKAAAL
jgi:DNA repair exonuclease SbcCD ATPase subunit